MQTGTAVLNQAQAALFVRLCAVAGIEPTHRQMQKFARKCGAAWQALRNESAEHGIAPNKYYARCTQ